jgi:hypothetical protein
MEEGGMSTISSVEMVWVVLDGEQRVVLMCAGNDASDVAVEWGERGYRIEQMGGLDVHDV